ncbi:MAG: hypothetical protein ABFD91_15370 [Anaerohalosphaeraceae bacterium]
MKMNKREVIAIVLAAIIIVIGYISCRKIITSLRTVETAENVKDIKGLPSWLYFLSSSAQNISYWKTPLYRTTYEYEVSEKDFLEWAKEHDIQLTSIDGFTQVFRYSGHTTSYPDADDPNQLSEYESKRMATVKEGYEYHTIQDNGGGLHLVYDSKNHKAYYDYSFR